MEFPGSILDHEDNSKLVPDGHEETKEETIQRVSQTTGVHPHGQEQSQLTGVEGGSTVFVLAAITITMLGLDAQDSQEECYVAEINNNDTTRESPMQQTA